MILDSEETGIDTDADGVQHRDWIVTMTCSDVIESGLLILMAMENLKFTRDR
jgi:hypothetical protein